MYSLFTHYTVYKDYTFL